MMIFRQRVLRLVECIDIQISGLKELEEVDLSRPKAAESWRSLYLCSIGLRHLCLIGLGRLWPTNVRR